MRSLLVRLSVPAVALTAACVTYDDPVDTPGELAGNKVVEPPPGGNILIVVVDDMGLDKVSAYEVADAGIIHTPNIDALVADGMRFENAWAMPLCEPSRAALQTGRYPRRTGLGANQSTLGGTHELDSAQWTIAEIASLSTTFTYDISYAGKWHLSTHESASGVGGPIVQGWHWYSGALGNLSKWSSEYPPATEPGYYLWEKVADDGTVGESTTYATTDTADDAIARIGAMTEPWILQVAFNGAHGPYEAPPQDLVVDPIPANTSSREDERLMVEALDNELGRVLAAMSADVRERTNIMLVGDNGTPGKVVEDVIDSRRDKGTLYEPGVRVPFVVQGPLVASPGTVSNALVHVVDVFPTVAEIVGVDLSTLSAVLDPTVPLAIDGRSLVPLLTHASSRPVVHNVLYTETFAPAGGGPYSLDLRAMRNQNYKLIVDDVNGVEQFFELDRDATDEGLDLLPCGLTAKQQAAYDGLSASMDKARSGLTFDANMDEIVVEEPEPGETPLLQDIGCVVVGA